MFTICSNKLSALIWETGCQFMENLSNCQFSIRCLTVWYVQPTDLPRRFGSCKTVEPIAALVLPLLYLFQLPAAHAWTRSPFCTYSTTCFSRMNRTWYPKLPCKSLLWSLFVLPLSDSHTISIYNLAFLRCTFVEIHRNLLILGK